MLRFPGQNHPQSLSLGCLSHLSREPQKVYLRHFFTKRKLKWQLKPHERAYLHPPKITFYELLGMTP